MVRTIIIALHKRARTTPAIRAAVAVLAARHGLGQGTHEAPTGEPIDHLTNATPPQHLQQHSTQPRPSQLPIEHYQCDAAHNRTASLHQPGPWYHNAAERLIEIKDNSQTLGQYHYDPMGRRIKKTNPGRHDLVFVQLGLNLQVHHRLRISPSLQPRLAQGISTPGFALVGR